MQLLGEDPDLLAEAARRLETAGADGIDLNMGCPVAKVVAKGQGAALMRDPLRAAVIFRTLRKAVAGAFTIKIRGGWDDRTVNAPEIARLAESEGVDGVTVHPRTRPPRSPTCSGGSGDRSALVRRLHGRRPVREPVEDAHRRALHVLRRHDRRRASHPLRRRVREDDALRPPARSRPHADLADGRRRLDPGAAHRGVVRGLRRADEALQASGLRRRHPQATPRGHGAPAQALGRSAHAAGDPREPAWRDRTGGRAPLPDRVPPGRVSRAATLAVALLLVASTAAAEESLRLADFGLKGQAVFKNFSHFSAAATDDQTFVDLALLQLEWSRRFAAWGAAKAVVEARDDDFGYARGLHFQIPETDPRRSYLSVKEATLAARRGPLDVTVGKQIFAWGTADAFNPTDRLNPYDYLDVLDNEKLGVWSASARLSVPRVSLVVVGVPYCTPSRLPRAHRRWTPAVRSTCLAEVDRGERPGRRASATQYAARLKGA